MAGATVTVTDTQRGTNRILTTDDSGQYNAPNLTPGIYSVKAEAKGFKTVERQNVVLEVGGEVRVDLSLAPGEQTQTVTVTEAIPLVDTTSSSLGGTMQNQVINDLPLNGRNFQNLLSLRPGVTKYPGGAGWTSSTNGTRPHDLMYLVDGINSNDPYMAQSVMNAVMAAGDAGTILPIDAIDEFKTEINPRAEYGWKPGAVVNVGIKSGTNSIHGTAFAFGRDGNWDARDYFNPVPQPTPPVSVEQYGGSIGGPIKKDKLFYFGNFEAQRYELGNPATHKVPISGGAGASDTTFGLIGACQTALNAGKLTAESAQLAGLSMGCVPLSNYPGLFPVASAGPGAPAVINSASNVITSNLVYSGVGKIDFHPNEKHSFSGMYFMSPGDGTFADDPTNEIAQQWLTVQHARSQVGSGSWTWTPNSSWVNEARVGYSHYYQTFFSNDANQNPANYTYNGATYHLNTGQTNPTYFGLPNITFQGGYSFYWGLGWPKIVGPDAVLQVSDHVSYLRGNHSFKFGGELLFNQSDNNVTANTKGPLRFPNIVSYFEGLPNRALFTAGNLQRHMYSKNLAMFVQDDWRVTPRVTLNLGIRYEIDGVLHERNNLLGNFDPIAGLVQVGRGITTPFNQDYNNFAPRLGLAWDVRGNGKTVIRAGGGMVYEQGSFDEFNAVGNLIGLRTVPTGSALYTNGSTTPTTAGGNIAVGQLTFTGGALTGVDAAWAAGTNLFSNSPACGDNTVTLPGGFKPPPCNIMGVDPNIRTPYIINWTLDMQRAITNNLSLDVAYVGNHGAKMLGLTDLNQAPVGTGWTPAILAACEAAPKASNCAPNSTLEQTLRPFAGKFPYIGFIDWLSNLDESNYNGLQVTATQRTSHGLSFIAGYTYSHSLDQCPDNWRCQVPMDSANTRFLYSASQFDLRHRFTYSVTYDLPNKKSPGQVLEGWSVNSIVTFMSRMPWDVSDTTTDFAGNNEISTQQTIGDHWNFSGNPSDFTTTKALLTTNNGAGGIPYFKGTGVLANPTANAACNAAAGSNPAAKASLAVLGCYAMGNSVLTPPAYGAVGDLGRNVFRGPLFSNWDLSITKQMKFKERLTAQFRAEAFNIINHPNIGNPSGGPGGGGNTFTDPSAEAGSSFGSRPNTPDIINSNPVLGTGGPRAIQLGLKLIF